MFAQIIFKIIIDVIKFNCFKFEFCPIFYYQKITKELSATNLIYKNYVIYKKINLNLNEC